MRLLIDTHVLIWWVNDLSKLPQHIQDILVDSGNEVFVSPVVPWEIAMKVHARKLSFDTQFLADFDNRIRALAFTPLPLTSAHAVAAGQLTGRHKDPFDRMLVAQAHVEQLALVTRDPALAGLGAQVIW